MWFTHSMSIAQQLLHLHFVKTKGVKGVWKFIMDIHPNKTSIVMKISNDKTDFLYKKYMYMIKIDLIIIRDGRRNTN